MTREETIESLLGAVPEALGILTPSEQRVLAASKTYFPDILMHMRVQQGASSLRTLTPEIVAEASMLSIAAAVSADNQLRELRMNLMKEARG